MSDWKTLADTIGLTIRPIDAWPGTLRSQWQRERGPYSASLKDTLGMLKTELNALNACDIVLQAAFRERDLRLDGLPRSGASPEHPGIILCFNVRSGKGVKTSRRRAFDRFTHWERNLRALAMNLHHLRAANLYGVEGDDQQYTGWVALPPPPADTSDEVARAVQLLWIMAGQLCDHAEILSSAETARQVIRLAQQKTHPDAGGDAGLFRRVQEAARLLKERHGL